MSSDYQQLLAIPPQEEEPEEEQQTQMDKCIHEQTIDANPPPVPDKMEDEGIGEPEEEVHPVQSRESPPSSSFSDFHSEGSCDSGKGGSLVHPQTPQTTTDSVPEEEEEDEVEGPEGAIGPSSLDPLIVYQFELPFPECGRLIGRGGHHVQYIRERTRARVVVNGHPTSALLKLCSVEGTRGDVREALKLIASGSHLGTTRKSLSSR